MSDGILQFFANFPWFNMILSGLVIFLLLGFIKIRQESEALKKELFRLDNQLRAINSGQLGMGRKLSQIFEEVADVEDRQINNSGLQDEDKSYRQAAILLAKGVSIEEVVESCGITPAEAELLATLHNAAPKNVVQA